MNDDEIKNELRTLWAWGGIMLGLTLILGLLVEGII